MNGSALALGALAVATAVGAGVLVMNEPTATVLTDAEKQTAIDQFQTAEYAKKGMYTQIKPDTDIAEIKDVVGTTTVVHVYSGPRGKGYQTVSSRKVDIDSRVIAQAVAKGSTTPQTYRIETRSTCVGNECTDKVWDWR